MLNRKSKSNPFERTAKINALLEKQRNRILNPLLNEPMVPMPIIVVEYKQPVVASIDDVPVISKKKIKYKKEKSNV